MLNLFSSLFTLQSWSLTSALATSTVAPPFRAGGNGPRPRLLAGGEPQRAARRFSGAPRVIARDGSRHGVEPSKGSLQSSCPSLIDTGFGMVLGCFWMGN